MHPDSSPVGYFFGGIMLIGLVIAVIYFLRNKHTVDDNSFSQAGVTVYFENRMIKIKGHTYSVDQVKRLRWETGYGEKRNISKAFIEVEDFNKPVHYIDFITPNAASTFISRLGMAIVKAGGPSFS
jgi:hypothetical protein